MEQPTDAVALPRRPFGDTMRLSSDRFHRPLRTPMSWRTTFIKNFGPNGFSGTTFGDWLRILRENRFDVDFRYWPRAAAITGNSLLNSLVRLWEEYRWSDAVERTIVPPPLFVLGIWRSGTTHLHNLLAKDDRFAFPNTYQVFYPHTLLSTEKQGSRVMQWFMPSTRVFDNVRGGVDQPQEDEFALVACGLSYFLTMVFPRNADLYRRYFSLRDATAAEREAWKSAFLRFLQKLTLKYQRPLILKSPLHTSRIEVLLELFPEAKFVHIHRDPYTVFTSTRHTWGHVNGWWGLQKWDVDDERILADYEDVYGAYFEQRSLIPPGNLCEVAYVDLDRDPLNELRRIYESLALPDFKHVEPALGVYLQSIAGYAKNRFPELSAETRRAIATRWGRCFDEWGYAR